MQSDLSSEFIIELLNDGRANPGKNVPFSCDGDRDEIANTLHWAVYKGHENIVRMLLNDDRVHFINDVDELGDSSGMYFQLSQFTIAHMAVM